MRPLCIKGSSHFVFPFAISISYPQVHQISFMHQAASSSIWSEHEPHINEETSIQQVVIQLHDAISSAI